MDQLLSGGLVNSRSMWESEPVTLSDGTTLTEAELLDHLLTTLAEDKNNEVWLLESVMRLAPTVGYDHWDLDGYNALRSYGMVGRPVLTGDELTISNIEADYRLASDGTVLALPEFDLGGVGSERVPGRPDPEADAFGPDAGDGFPAGI